jgi:hypothetical protein
MKRYAATTTGSRSYGLDLMNAGVIPRHWIHIQRSLYALTEALFGFLIPTIQQRIDGRDRAHQSTSSTAAVAHWFHSGAITGPRVLNDP